MRLFHRLHHFPDRYYEKIDVACNFRRRGENLDSYISWQAAGVAAVSFVVGASMELFMIKTGFYEIATRKEAERRALAVWAREEQARIRMERRQRMVPQAVEPRYFATNDIYFVQYS